MNYFYPKCIEQLIESYMKLPGIGYKTAVRLAFFMVKMSKEDVSIFINSMIDIKKKLYFCKICNNISENKEKCIICKDKNRNNNLILIVEEFKNIMSIEKTKKYNGLYHVLNGVLSPIDGIGPEDINIKNLIKRLYDKKIKEVIIATNMTIEGEATAIYISKLIKPIGIIVTRLANGLSVGSDIEYIDDITLIKSIENRQKL